MKLLLVLLVACSRPAPRAPMPIVGHYCASTCMPGPLVAPFLAELEGAAINPELADCCKEPR